ncbi:hypothetical protein IHE45_12G075500 [Dioscorea alata]|uniref:Uncharacterized protein n=1 Tax=Dioscorea alata TaxID=55571 RepID=A0ACB7V363_DIOAL|nr:hypothetical protein IHE45_12G075500 [Dioscorea alata]
MVHLLGITCLSLPVVPTDDANSPYDMVHSIRYLISFPVWSSLKDLLRTTRLILKKRNERRVLPGFHKYLSLNCCPAKFRTPRPCIILR